MSKLSRCAKQSLMPQIRACAQAKGLKKGDPEIRQQCRSVVIPCVQSARKPSRLRACRRRRHRRTIPRLCRQMRPQFRPTFVAPPRTIADITAILDSEKPDAAKIAARKAAADATPPSNASSTKLAQFYYDRGNARALLARNKDALADGLQALAVDKNSSEQWQVTHIRAVGRAAIQGPWCSEAGDRNASTQLRRRVSKKCTGALRSVQWPT